VDLAWTFLVSAPSHAKICCVAGKLVDVCRKYPGPSAVVVGSTRTALHTVFPSFAATSLLPTKPAAAPPMKVQAIARKSPHARAVSADTGYTALGSALSTGSGRVRPQLALGELLLKRGAAADARSRFGTTALHSAVIFRDELSVHLLLRCGKHEKH